MSTEGLGEAAWSPCTYDHIFWETDLQLHEGTPGHGEVVRVAAHAARRRPLRALGVARLEVGRGRDGQAQLGQRVLAHGTTEMYRSSY